MVQTGLRHDSPVDLKERVAAMAVRVGHDAPPISRLEGSERQPCAFTLPPGPLGPALILHNHLEEKPEALQDFLIAQALVSDRLGVNQQFKTLIWSIRSVIVVLVGVLVALTLAVGDRYGWPVLFAPFVSFVVVFAVAVLPVAVWSRRFARRQDQVLAQVLGRDQLIEALRLDLADRPRKRDWYWVRTGLRPTPGERLRRLGWRNASVAD